MTDEPTILLIEDDESIAEPLIFGLQSEGMKVLHAPNGAQGLALARSDHPDAILLDVMLPDTDGFAVCRTLRPRVGDADSDCLPRAGRRWIA